MAATCVYLLPDLPAADLETKTFVLIIFKQPNGIVKELLWCKAYGTMHQNGTTIHDCPANTGLIQVIGQYIFTHKV